jgi:hypothetical protein
VDMDPLATEELSSPATTPSRGPAPPGGDPGCDRCVLGDRSLDSGHR